LHQDPVDPMPYQERGALLNELTAGGVDALVEMAGPNSGCQMTMIEVRHLGGALARPAKVPNAVGHRDASFTVWGAVAGGPEEISVAVAQMDAILARLEPWGNGGKYLNFMSGADPVEAAYPAEIYARLQAVKRAYDPGNVFRLNNHNILPQA
jgi:hypothetical protein